MAKRKKGLKHSKNACNTCRLRRVKCDETKPSCLRCRDFGVKCDEYAHKEIHLYLQSVAEVPVSLWSQVKTSVPFNFADEDEYQYFQLFCNNTINNLFPFCSRLDTQGLIYLQACSEPSIRSLATAIGALHKTLLVSNLYLDDSSSVHHQKAIRLYSNAISMLKAANHRGDRDLQVTLISCVLIFGFEAFYGNVALAAAQMRISTGFIVDSKSGHSMKLTDDRIITLLRNLKSQTSVYDQESHAIDLVGNTNTPLPEVFGSIEEAQYHLQQLIWRLQNFLVSFGFKPVYNQQFGETTPQSRASLTDQSALWAKLRQWYSSFQQFLRANPHLESSTAVLMARLQYRTTAILIETALLSDPMIFDYYTADFREMLHISRKIHRSLQAGCTRFCLELAVILPLYIIGLRCRVCDIRKEAIELLLAEHRREGIWDSLLAGRTAEWLRRIEEEHLQDGHVPAWARVVFVTSKSNYNLQSRTANLVCFQRKGPQDSELRKLTTAIRW